MEKIRIALTFDDGYAEYGVVLMTSILANKSESDKIHFHILDGGLSEDIKTKLLKFEDCEMEFHSVDNKIFDKYKKGDYYSATMLWTMILPDVVQAEKLIYLDSDIIVNDSLKELWDIDLGDNFVAAVEDANGKKYSKRYKVNSKFFNSGVMLINCAKWRECDITKRAVEMSMKNTGTTWGYDQTVLNILFQGQVKFLDLKWNLQYCRINVWPTYENKEEYKLAIKKPSIIHYVGDYKPWKLGLGCYNPKQEEYLKYHKMSPFALSDYKKWQFCDRMMFCTGIFSFIKRYPLFFLRKQFWKNLTTRSYS